MELLLIVVLALIVLGPEKLPEVMAAVAKAYAELRRATLQLSDGFNRALAAELNEGRTIARESSQVLSDARSSMNAAVAGTQTASSREQAPPSAVNGALRPAS